MTDNLTNNTKYAFVSAEILQFENEHLISWFFPEIDDIKEISLDLHDIREKSVKKNKVLILYNSYWIHKTYYHLKKLQ